MAQYFGIMDGSGDAWGVRVPDLPGCHGGVATANEAVADAISAAREWAEHRAAKGFALPPATPLSQILHQQAQPGEAIVTIPVSLEILAGSHPLAKTRQSA